MPPGLFVRAFFLLAVMSACGEGELTPLSADRHQVAQRCGPEIASRLNSHEPIAFVGPMGGSLDHFSLIAEPVRYGIAKPKALALPAGVLYRSARCLSLSRDYRQPITIYLPETKGRPLLGAELRLSHPSLLPRGQVAQLRLRAVNTSFDDFRRCGHPPTPIPASATQQQALVIWPHDGDPARPPKFLTGAQLSFTIIAPGQKPRQVQPNSRGCLYSHAASKTHATALAAAHATALATDRAGQRLFVRNTKGVLVATRPLTITPAGDVPLILCPRSGTSSGPRQLQMAVPELSGPSGPSDIVCQSGFQSYCQLALKGRLKPELGDWLRRLAGKVGTTNCAVIAERLREGTLSTVTSPGAADLEALRYDLPELSALTVKAPAGVSYLPRLFGLKELTIHHKQPGPYDFTFTERQPQLTDLSLSGGPVKLSSLPLPQLTFLALKGASLSSLADIAPAQKLTDLDVSYNGIVDLGPLTALPRLSSLVVRGNPLTDITPLLAMPALTRVDVSELNELDVSVLTRLPQLTDLTVRHSRLTELSWLKVLTALDRLDVSDNAIADLQPLRGLRELSHLSAERNGIKDIAALAPLNRLQLVALAENDILSLMPLRQLPLIWRFTFAGNPLGTTQKKSTDNCPVDAKAKVIREFCTR